MAFVLLGLAWGVSAAWAQPVALVNHSFEEGDGAPTGWALSGGEGAWSDDAVEGRHAVSVTGTGPGDANYWWSGVPALEPFAVYRLDFHARRIESEGGCPISGPVFCNRDLSVTITDDWLPFTSIFITPSEIDPAQAFLRFGQWHVTGTVAYDAVRLVRTTPVYSKAHGIRLGEGESIEGNRYLFRAPFAGTSFNQARPLARQMCAFNTPRWVFDTESEVVYRHALPGLQHVEARVEVQVGYYASGALAVEASADGEDWVQIGTIDQVDTKAFDVPAAMLPADEVWVRLSSAAEAESEADFDPGSFQVYGYAFESVLDRAPGDFSGKTVFVSETETDERLGVTILSLGDATPGGENAVAMRVDNKSGVPIRITPTVVTTTDGDESIRATSAVGLDPGVRELRVPYDLERPGRTQLELSLGAASLYRAEAEVAVSSLFDVSYGERLPDSSDAVGLWWASSGWKVSRTRPVAQAEGSTVRIQVARNETEAAQIVLRPARALRGLTATCEDLSGPRGGTLPAECIEILRVRYVPVQTPTDQAGAVAPWPDPLPPFVEPIDLDAGRNQPLWVRVRPPADARAGVYRGRIVLRAEGFEAVAPLEVELFGFTLPDRMTCSTAMGLIAPRIFRYHGLKDAGDKRVVLKKYFETLSAHHISPYEPAPLDGFGVTWPGQGVWEGGARDRAEKHGGASSMRITDGSDQANAWLQSHQQVPIPEGGVRLRFAYRTAQPGHWFNAVFSHFDAAGEWLTGRNVDMHSEGTGAWQEFDRSVTTFPESAEVLTLAVFGAEWMADGSTTGTVWIDDLILTDVATGEVLLEGEFEPLPPEALTPQFEWTAWDAAMERAIDGYHFNSFVIPIQGMGGRGVEPTLLGYTEDTDEYQMAFTAYCQGVEAHLREKGWLDEAFVYWFDEPEEKDYSFVMDGYRRLEQAAPGIRRMLTEQVEEPLIGGPNLWCPLSAWLDAGELNERQADGDEAWWYICTVPKAPYATLFIDHPATELRVWLWQTWKRRLDGILIWETNYWSSPLAYPDPEHPQNPYEDPMGWIVAPPGVDLQPGTKIGWGNGDGRFVYPPEAAADGRPAGPVLDGPVDSIRLEMLRDGIEDFEYLAILERLLERHGASLSATKRKRYEALLAVPDAVSADLPHFALDPEPIQRRREEIARGIARLSRSQ